MNRALAQTLEVICSSIRNNSLLSLEGQQTTAHCIKQWGNVRFIMNDCKILPIFSYLP